ncbi:hypothetical protein tinsulaeT_15940 [Thalassotalea insulae]|uniref:DUF8051 domain-containing protein n=1 Tax=Thalassotalea insulae TaxID=2056778 RepID=A0ABQ6GRK9_9GAMM|nr:hypothetical protein [Thalassotalea insulae]GLX78254.1 hypothetical protein tinsulaeT_15940 [Thalassotalea insulae]
MNYAKSTIYVLILAIITLAWMVPGGPVETRDFSHLAPEVAWSFNIFLTSLMLVAIALVYFMFKKQRWAYQLTGVVGLAFFLVFLLDLAKIFPVSPDPMSTLLFVLEIAGVVFGLLLSWLSYQAIRLSEQTFWVSTITIPNSLLFIGIGMLIFGAFVVYFATASTLRF